MPMAASSIIIIPGARPGVFFTPNLGLTITDWYVLPIMPHATVGFLPMSLTRARIGVFCLPFRLSFSYLTCYASLGGTGGARVGLFTLEGENLLDVESDVAPGLLTIDAALILESGFYWLTLCQAQAGTAPNILVWQSGIVSLISTNVPPGAPLYIGYIDIVGGALPSSIDPILDIHMDAPNCYQPTMRFTS